MSFNIFSMLSELDQLLAYTPIPEVALGVDVITFAGWFGGTLTRTLWEMANHLPGDPRE